MIVQDQQIKLYHRWSLIATILAGSIFLLGIVGWLFQVPEFTHFSLHWNAIRPISALCGILLVIANGLMLTPNANARIKFVTVAPVILIAITSLTEWAINSPSAIGDKLFPADYDVLQIEHPGRISACSSILFLMTSVSLLFGKANHKQIKRSQYGALLVLYFCFFLLVGHLFKSDLMTSRDSLFYVSIHSIIGMVALNLAILFRTPESGIIRFYRQKSQAVRVNLRLLIQTITLLLVIGWLLFEGEELGLYNSRLGLSMMITVFIAVLIVVISRSAARLSRMENSKASLVGRLEMQKDQLQLILNRTNDGVYILDKNLVVTYANPNALKTVNKPEKEVVGFHVSNLFADPAVAENYMKNFEQAMASQQNIDTTYHNKQHNRWFSNTIFPSPNGITIFYKEVTAEKLAELEVSQARDHFKSLVENLKDVVIRVNLDGAVSYISPASSGHSESIKMKLADWLREFLITNLRSIKADNLASKIRDAKEFSTIECTITDGDSAWIFEVRYTPELNPAGEFTSFLAICRDITEAVKVRDERQRLNSVIHNMSAMVCQANEKLEVSYINPAGRQMLILPSEGPLSPLLLTTIWQRQKSRFMHDVAFPVALQQGTWMGESIIENSVGKMIPVMVIMIVHRDKNGEFIYLSVVAYDLTEIKQTETALRESEKRWQFAVDGSNLGLWDWNIKSNKIFYSKQWKAMLGYAENEIGTDPLEFETRLHPEDKGSVMNQLNEYFQGVQSHYDCVHRMQKKDGSYMYIRDRGMITDFNADGSPSRMIGTHSDVTVEYKQAQMLQKTKEELRSLAVHLQNIREEERLNLSKMMQEEVGQQLSSMKMDFSSFEHSEKLLDREIRNKISKAQRILEQTIQVVKKISTDLRPSIIEDLGLVASLQSLTQEFKLRFDIRIRFSSLFDNMETSPKTALCFYRVYQEALSNIARHSFATKIAVRLTISEEGDLILAVKDDGIGFNLISNSLEDNLGLVESRERMLMINGDMKITSIPGKGTLLLVKAPMTVEV